MNRKAVPVEDLDPILGRMHRCAALLSVLIDCEVIGGRSLAIDALDGVRELLELACDSLQNSMDAAGTYQQDGQQSEGRT